MAEKKARQASTSAEEPAAKKSRKEGEGGPRVELEDDAVFRIPIATPFATSDTKLAKKIFSLVRHAREKRALWIGIKDVGKAVRKNRKGLCVLAANISPMDCISHVPGLMEDNKIPYIWLASKREIGQAVGAKRTISCVLIDNVKLPTEDQASLAKVIANVEHLQVEALQEAKAAKAAKKEKSTA
eukprot:TRINITY_DN1349_c0_g2_i1.p1 TRINITY_DN1349_c0_g2~~TRINITY_DN1349_c0_g2_i1.p1  ORF type:complete len:201 (+),score=47.97 TRINITY_DN1349_c0_g2_i1:51-605(+)